jgi:hypothetical protein
MQEYQEAKVRRPHEKDRGLPQFMAKMDEGTCKMTGKMTGLVLEGEG